jgi:SAM-dependent methyltransferase
VSKDPNHSLPTPAESPSLESPGETALPAADAPSVSQHDAHDHSGHSHAHQTSGASYPGQVIVGSSVVDAAFATLSPGQVEDTFYQILSGGARYVLFTSLIDFDLPSLFQSGPRTANEITAWLHLDRHRARKWLHALTLAGLLTADAPASADGDHDAATRRFRLAPAVARMFSTGNHASYFYREFLRYYRASMAQALYPTLRGVPVEYAVRYPPTAPADIALLHEWMRNTALVTLTVLRRHVDFSGVRQLLDVGGGDGTMAMELWRDFPNLNITVFNLPTPVDMLRETAARLGATDRVLGVPGDFRYDDLPVGYDMVMFSRVLADWPPELCRALLQKAHRSLSPGGRLVICEPLADQNPDLALSWEHSYLPYDDFGLNVYKPLSLYQTMLAETGYTVTAIHPRDDNTIHCVIVAQKNS